MLEKLPLLSTLLLLAISLNSVCFATGQYGIGFSKSPSRLLGGKCKQTCEMNDVELKGLKFNCDSDSIYCMDMNFSLWSNLKKFFQMEADDKNGTKVFVAKKQCLVRGDTVGSYEELPGTVCREKCKDTEIKVTETSTACVVGYICCSDPEMSSWTAFWRWTKNAFDDTNSKRLG